jgi:predicted nucleic acid-binding protein
MQPDALGAVPVVLDTNVVLEWQVFRDPRTSTLASALEKGQIRWFATPAMLAELATVLARPLAPRWGAQKERTLACRPSARATLVRAPIGLPGCSDAGAPTYGLRCSDPTDQKFIDLAVALPARWLVTRDRALLKLARRAARCGLSIVVPEGWSEDGKRLAAAS